MRALYLQRRTRHRLPSLAEIQAALVPWAPVAGWLLIVHFMVYRAEADPFPHWLLMHVFYPLLWGSAGVIGWLGWRYGVEPKPRLGWVLPVLAALIGAYQVAQFVIAGLFFGFGHSPYDHRPWVVLGNLVYITAILVGVEISRACLVGSIGRRRPTLALVLVSLFLTFIGLPPGRLSSITGVPSLLRVGGETLMPAFGENLLASLLALVGGPIPAIAYRALPKAFEWLSPILPDLPWLVTSFLGTMAPALGLLLTQSAVRPLARRETRRSHRRASLSPGWALVGAASVGMLWFNTGLLGIQPTLVTGVSMLPAMRTGDIAITREVPTESIQVGDVVRFREQGVYVIHRVIEVQRDGGEIVFITQGDANNVADPPVPASRLEGKVVLVLPKLGWLGIGLRKIIEWTL